MGSVMHALRSLSTVIMLANDMFDVYENGKCKENEQDEMRDYECRGY